MKVVKETTETLDLRQIELDVFEERLLTELFGSTELKVNPIIRIYLKEKHGIANLEESVQQIINVFEEVMKPLMYDNGKVCSEKFFEKIGTMFPQINTFIEFIPKSDFRLVDVLDTINIRGVLQQFNINI